MPQQQKAPKGGRKLRRCAKHKGMYAAQFFRTSRNKAAAKRRIERRKLEKPFGYKTGKLPAAPQGVAVG